MKEMARNDPKRKNKSKLRTRPERKRRVSNVPVKRLSKPRRRLNRTSKIRKLARLQRGKRPRRCLLRGKLRP